jgi:hypothetical protein
MVIHDRMVRQAGSMGMTEAIQKNAPLEPGAIDSGMEPWKTTPEERRDFGARMTARGCVDKPWENTGITMEQAIDALRVAVEENLCAYLDLEQR